MADIVIPYVIPLNAQKPKNLSLVPTDPGSRYKTRQLQVQIVGKSKMMKTVLVNILDVAKDMQVPPSYVGTFMGYEIGAQAKFDAKKPERQQAFISGEHSTQDLSKLALKFIQEVVLCPRCGLPEIVCEVAEEKVHGRCRACGGNEILRITNDKFKRYILNHPPNTKGDSFSKEKNVQKKEASVKNKALKEKEREEAQEREKAKAQEEEVKEDDNVVWYSDTSAEATKARREKMLPDAFTKVAKKIPEVSEVQPLVGSPDKLVELKTSNGLSDGDFVPVLFATVIPNDSTTVSNLITKNKAAFKKFVNTSEGQLALLKCLEKFCGETQPSLVTKVSPIIKQLYDEELLEEENIFAWNNDKTGAIAKVREQAAPIVKWLKEAEEESDGSEEDD